MVEYVEHWHIVRQFAVQLDPGTGYTDIRETGGPGAAAIDKVSSTTRVHSPSTMAPVHFNCDVCKGKIHIDNPRIHCLECADYDLCANCAVAQRFNGTHELAHRTQVLKISGGGVHPAVPSTTVIVHGGAAAAALPSETSTTAIEAGVSTLSVGVSAYTMPPRDSTPPQLPPRTPSQPAPSAYQPPAPNPPAHSPPPPVAPPIEAATGWGPFFRDDMSPTPAFTQLMSSILTHLDTGRTGYLVPEAFSTFLDDQAYPLEGNTWKSNLKATRKQSAVDAADAALKRVFDLFSIEYVLRPRAGNPNVAGGGTMPLLTLKGFMDITTLEMLADPSTEWGSISRVIRAYALPAVADWGELPRSVLPEVPDPRILARLAQVKTVSEEEGKRRLEAARVKAMFQAQGEQNALDLLDDRRYHYTYR
ncbi:hypothetical protein C8R46DRAFT_309969 [Mycena filopes]|nr:hypothetical protein C8R46DRAFT_309969 [Mycena filopes]